MEVIVFGLGRYGSRLLQQLRDAGIEAVGVDFDPEAVREFKRSKLPVRFGDGEDAGFPQWDSNRALLHALTAAGFHGQVAAAARDVAHRRALVKAKVLRIRRDPAADHDALWPGAEPGLHRHHHAAGALAGLTPISAQATGSVIGFPFAIVQVRSCESPSSAPIPTIASS